jgi:hypothetical protein
MLYNFNIGKMGNDCAGKFGKLKDPGLTRVVSAPNLGVTGL